MKKKSIHFSRFIPPLAFAFFTVIVTAWLYSFNRYQVIDYQEQMQLFRFNVHYFESFLSLPGGMSSYIGAFFTQFFYYPLLGALLCGILLTGISGFLYLYNTRINPKMGLSFLPFVPALLIVLSIPDNLYFDLSYLTGLLIALLCSWLYTLVHRPSLRIACGVVLLLFLYPFTAGNVWIAALLFVLYELLTPEDNKKWIRYFTGFIYLLLTLSLIFLFKSLGIYYASQADLFAGLTPFSMLLATTLLKYAWISVPVLVLLERLLQSVLKKKTVYSYISLGLIVFVTFGLLWKKDVSKTELLNQLLYETRHENWTEVVALASKYPDSNRLVICLNNLALAKQGLLAERMFNYPQVGIGGLFLDRQLVYSSLNASGILFYQLGFMAEALSDTYEAMETQVDHPNVETLHRLAQISLLTGDTAGFKKYNQPLEESLFYAGSVIRKEGMPAPLRSEEDFFINYTFPENDLHFLLKANPDNKLLFEYIMAGLLLRKDLNAFIWTYDQYYKNFDYTSVPVHFQEAFVAYCNGTGQKEEFYENYPVSKTVLEQFRNYYSTFRNVRGTTYGQQQMQQKFGRTFWYYMNFVQPISVNPNEVKNRY